MNHARLKALDKKMRSGRKPTRYLTEEERKEKTKDWPKTSSGESKQSHFNNLPAGIKQTDLDK